MQLRKGNNNYGEESPTLGIEGGPYIMTMNYCAGIFIIINYIDRPSLFCSSMSLFETLTNVTPFCVISGKFHLSKVALHDYHIW